MTARRLPLLAAGFVALTIAASETALWLQLRDVARAHADLSRRVDAHRCLPLAGPPPSDFFTARMPELPVLVQPAPMTDPALKEA